MRDPLEQARARGVDARARLVHRAGGLLQAQDVAARLGISLGAVHARRRRGAILAVPDADGWRYPACQLSGDTLLPGIGQVVGAFRDVDPWQQLAVLLAPSTRYEGQSALDLLAAGEVEAARSIAGTYGEQG